AEETNDPDERPAPGGRSRTRKHGAYQRGLGSGSDPGSGNHFRRPCPAGQVRRSAQERRQGQQGARQVTGGWSGRQGQGSQTGGEEARPKAESSSTPQGAAGHLEGDAKPDG